MFEPSPRKWKGALPPAPERTTSTNLPQPKGPGDRHGRDIPRTPQRAGQRPQRHRLRPDLPEGASAMPMIDVYAIAGTFPDKHQLAADLAAAVMTIEQVPDIPMFRQNTAAFIHDLPPGSLSNVDGDTNYVRIQVLTNAGALDRGKQLAVVERLANIAADAAGDPSLVSRTWVLLTEAPDGGWGLAGHANTNEELVLTARAQIARIHAGGTTDQ